MGTYYYLLNDSKKERVHYDNCIKYGALTANPQVQSAIVNYMMCNLGDLIRLMPDIGWNGSGYKDIDLSKLDLFRGLTHG